MQNHTFFIIVNFIDCSNNFWKYFPYGLLLYAESFITIHIQELLKISSRTVLCNDVNGHFGFVYKKALIPYNIWRPDFHESIDFLNQSLFFLVCHVGKGYLTNGHLSIVFFRSGSENAIAELLYNNEFIF